jgi:thioredoxin 1
MAEMHQFNDDNFAEQVLGSPTPVLVDFTAAWCGPCQMLDPVVAKLNEEWGGAVKVGLLDIDQSLSATMHYGVLSVPTLILFRNGQPVARATGYMPRERLLAKLGPHLK